MSTYEEQYAELTRLIDRLEQEYDDFNKNLKDVHYIADKTPAIMEKMKNGATIQDLTYDEIQILFNNKSTIDSEYWKEVADRYSNIYEDERNNRVLDAISKRRRLEFDERQRRDTEARKKALHIMSPEEMAQRDAERNAQGLYKRPGYYEQVVDGPINRQKWVSPNWVSAEDYANYLKSHGEAGAYEAFMQKISANPSAATPKTPSTAQKGAFSPAQSAKTLALAVPLAVGSTMVNGMGKMASIPIIGDMALNYAAEKADNWMTNNVYNPISQRLQDSFKDFVNSGQQMIDNPYDFRD